MTEMLGDLTEMQRTMLHQKQQDIYVMTKFSLLLAISSKTDVWTGY